MVVTIPRAALGITSEDFTVNFKWSDNMQKDGDIMEFYVSGDVAPGARFKYSFTTLSAPAEEETTTAEAVTDATTSTPTDATDTTGTESQTEEGKKGGCKSALGAACAGAVVAAGAALIICKKKEDD
jgi:hypothetical protein